MARLVVVGYMLLISVYVFLRLLARGCGSLSGSPCYQKYMVKFRDLLFWNGVITLLMLGANVILTAAFIILFSKDESSGTDSTRTLNLLLATGACALYAGFVLASIYLFRKYREVLDEWPFLRTYGALSKNLRKSSKWPLSYIFAFIVRRAALVFIVVWNHKTISLYGILLVQLLYCVYLCGVRPMYRAEHRQEVITEYVFLVLAYFSLLFTDYIPSGLTRHSLGYIQITFLMVFIGYKVLYIVVATLRGFWVFVKKCRRKLCQRKGEKGEEGPRQLELSEREPSFPHAGRKGEDADAIEESG